MLVRLKRRELAARVQPTIRVVHHPARLAWRIGPRPGAIWEPKPQRTIHRAKRTEPLRCAFRRQTCGHGGADPIRRITLNPIRPIGTVVAVLSLAAATTYTSPAATAREADIPFRSIVPNSWTLLPSELQSYGRRFVSPAGDAWLWFFAVPANREAAVNANADQFPPPPAERVTYERWGSEWVVSSGYRGNRIFYGRAMLACNGTKWRHIEFEYPASEKRHFDNFVTRTSFALRAYQDVGCGG